MIIREGFNLNITAIIPSLNPDEMLINTVESLIGAGIEHIIVIDDGSSEEYAAYFDQVISMPECTLLRHRQNRGKGAALKSAFRYYLEHPSGNIGVVTVDGDNQHKAKDVLRCAEALDERPEALVLGVRSFIGKNVPLKSKLGNWLTKFIFKFVCGINVSDTQTGLRAISNDNIQRFLEAAGDRYEYETNMLLEAKAKSIPITEVKIASVYIDGNKSSHFNPLVDSFRIYKMLLKFITSSVASFFIDILFFWLLNAFSPITAAGTRILVATIGSRGLSSLFNYFVNRKMVFSGNQSGKRESMLRYYILCVLQALASFGGVYLLTSITRVNIMVIKVVVDLTLFFISYNIQREWVFKKRRAKKKNNSAETGRMKMKATSKVRRIVGRILATLGVVLGSVLIFLVGVTAMLSFGPSKTMRDIYVMSAMESSAGKFLARMYFSDAQIRSIESANKAKAVNTVTDGSLVNVAVTPSSSAAGSSEQDIQVQDVKGSSFKGKMMLIHDPSRVYVATLPEYGKEVPGLKLEDMIKRDHAIAGVNAGGFIDPNGQGKGGEPLGIVIGHSKLLYGKPDSKSTVIGFDKSHRLIVGDMTAQQALDKNITDAMSFGPVLIVNGEAVPVTGTGGGLNPRTAIGQRKDGTVLLLVIDGRQTSSLGASMKDIIDVMLSFGAVNAANLDGGSSSMMFYKGSVINSCASLEGARALPDAVLVK